MKVKSKYLRASFCKTEATFDICDSDYYDVIETEQIDIGAKIRVYFYYQNKYAETKFCCFRNWSISVFRCSCLKLFIEKNMGIRSRLSLILVLFCPFSHRFTG